MKHFFDITILFFAISLILVGTIIFNSFTRNKPANIRVAAIQNTQISDYSDSFATINKGDSLTILGADFREFRFLVATDNGLRGWIPQEAIDNRGIIYDTELITDNGKTEIISGDTVILLGRSGDKYAQKMKFKAVNGQQDEVSISDLTTVTGYKVRKFDYNGGDYILSHKKFQSKYIGNTFQENENLYRPAIHVRNTKDGKAAEYDLRVFNKSDGKFYKVIINYKDNVATSYKAEVTRTTNRIFLKYLPLVPTIIDVSFFSQLISANVFDDADFDSQKNSVFLKIAAFFIGIIFFLALIGYVAFMNQTILFLMFGLLRFRLPLKFISNLAFPKVVLVLTIISTYIWIVLGLCKSFHWWYFIPIVLIATYWITNKVFDWFSDFPSNRCPDCKSLYTINYDSEEFINEYQEWRQETKSTKIGSRSRSEWVHDTEVTKWSDGSKTERAVNQREVTHTTRTYNNDVYNVLYLVHVYKQTYKCEHCDYEEYGSRKSSSELDRKYKGSYVDTTTTHSGY